MTGQRFTHGLWTEFVGAATAGRAARTKDQRTGAKPPGMAEMARDACIRLKLQGESIASKLLLWGRSYAIPKRLESSSILLMGDTGTGKSSAIRQILRQVRSAATAPSSTIRRWISWASSTRPSAAT